MWLVQLPLHLNQIINNENIIDGTVRWYNAEKLQSGYSKAWPVLYLIQIVSSHPVAKNRKIPVFSYTNTIKHNLTTAKSQKQYKPIH